MYRICLRLCALLLTLSLAFSAHAMTRDEMRAAYKKTYSAESGESPYAEKPDSAGFTSVGSLSKAAEADALALVNFMRALAGLESVGIDPLYALRARNAALVLAGNDVLSHTPEQPEGMSDEIYQSGYIGAASSNITKFNWMHGGILLDGMKYFARDDGESNLAVLGHRRWLLNPRMEKTGFGLSNAQSGNSFVVMYAVDGGNDDAEWNYVTWPAAGAFPTEFMQPDIAWSVSLNDTIYDLNKSNPLVTLTEEGLGLVFRFEPSKGRGDGYCTVSEESCGSGKCLIFRPDFSLTGFDAYEQNQLWKVRIENLADTNGNPCEIEYVCEMASLYPQDVANVEISRLNAELAVGESLALSANVIPAYADDLRVFWSSSDPSVASVDESGAVKAHATGQCIITVSGINGRTDRCEITVK